MCATNVHLLYFAFCYDSACNYLLIIFAVIVKVCYIPLKCLNSNFMKPLNVACVAK